MNLTRAGDRLRAPSKTVMGDPAVAGNSPGSCALDYGNTGDAQTGASLVPVCLMPTSCRLECFRRAAPNACGRGPEQEGSHGARAEPRARKQTRIGSPRDRLAMAPNEGPLEMAAKRTLWRALARRSDLL